MRASEEQRTRTKAEEGVSLEAYADTQDPPVWTVGFGHAATNPRPVHGELDGEIYIGPPKRGVSISMAEADRLFDEDALESEDAINGAVRHELTQGQFDACFDFCHHYGTSRFLGSTLLEKINFNPTATEKIAYQFQRWNINAGRRDAAIYRRACRRACVYAGVPIPNLLWRTPKSGFPWAVSQEDEIDHSITPTAMQFIEMGRKAALPPVFDPSKPFPSTPPKPAVSVEPVGGSLPARDSGQAPEATAGLPASAGDPQLSQSSAASPVAPDKPELVLKDKVPAGGVQSPPSPAGEGGPVNTSQRPPVPPPRLQPPPPSIGQQRDAVDSTRNARDWSEGAKSMILSRRFWGLFLVMIGRIWMLKSGSTAVLTAVSDPLITELFSGFAVMMIGELLQYWGERKARRPLR